APFIALFGESTKAHYCSGRNVGLATDGLQALWVAFDFMDESETCKGLRAEIYREDERAVRAHIKAIKEQFKELLINPTPAKYKDAQNAPQFMGITGADSSFEAVVVWRRRIADGWFFGVDNSLTNNATGSFIDPQLVESVRNLSRLYTESSDPLRWVFSQALLDLGRKKPVPPATVLLEDSKLAEFLNWLGGEEEILKKRKQYFISVLIQTDIKRISGFMSENDMALLEEGVKAGFLTKSGQNYEFRRDRDYFEVLSRQTLNAVVNDDIQQIKNLAMYASHKIQKLGENKENAFDLQILSPIIESIATKGQFELNEAVVSIYTGQSGKNDAFLAAMKTVAAEFEQLLKAEAAQDAATDIEIGAISGAKECFEQFNSSSYPDIESCLSAKSIMNSKYEKLAYALKILRKMDPARFEKIIDTEGRFMSEEKAYKWAKKEYLQAVKNLRGLDKFEPEERKIWSDNLLLMAEAKIALLKRRIASEIILKTIFDHFPKGETDFFETWSARAFKHLSAIYKTLHKESKNVDAAKISSLFENSFNGMIDPVSGAIKDNKSFDKWISDEVIKTADIQLEQLEKQLKTYLSITVTSEEQDEALKQLIAFNQLAKEAVQKAKSYYNGLKD
ncbi:MAG: hypothetical protein HYY43_05660, partial [Deltaproteobacteria bacterium]|nr:hypothetical protein [Deltaproteobacteria bacterium]